VILTTQGLLMIMVRDVRTGHNSAMKLDEPWPLLGGLTPQQFLKRHWQKKPLLIRQAWPGVRPPLSRSALFKLAGHEDVEARLVWQGAGSSAWQLKRGPFSRRQLPPLNRANWTLLVQGVDLHNDAAHQMLSRFRFVPDARLDDLMISYAADGGGVGPHLDSYDVFLLQVHGRRRWRIGPVQDDRVVAGLPVRILKHFKPTEAWDLEPGDMLYLPPRWGHEGIALGGCMTCSIGFRAPVRGEMAAELLARMADGLDEVESAQEDRSLYRDAGQGATLTPGRIPSGLQAFAAQAVQAQLDRPGALDTALGELLTEPKPQVWFEQGGLLEAGEGVTLDRRSRMMYDDRHVFLNGESFRAAGADARWMARLADLRRLEGHEVRLLSQQARQLVSDWVACGWLLPVQTRPR
jgi:50S ribosomal protein L16 3-hydroxylase